MFKKTTKTIFKILEWVLFAVIVIVFFISFSPLLPFKNIPQSYTVKTGSMVPAIKPGAVSIVVPKEAEELEVGDVIAFTSPNDSTATIIHRINSIKSEDPVIFETKGDNNNAADNWDLFATDVIGEHVFAIPFLGYVGDFVTKPLGFSVTVLVPALLFIVMQIMNIKKGIDEEVERRLSDTKEEKPKKQKIKDTLNGVKSIFMVGIIISTLALVGANEAVAFFIDIVEVSNISISVKDFVPPPAPELESPEDGDILTTDGLVMNWYSVADYKDMNNPVYYIYQSARNDEFDPLAYASSELGDSEIPAPGTSDAKYWWRVKACDQLDNCSDWSEVWTVIIDNTAPVAKVTNVDDGDVFQDDLDVRADIIDENLLEYRVRLLNMDNDDVEKDTDWVSQESSLNDEGLDDWDISGLSEGDYKIVLEAKDKVGFDDKDNVEIEIRRNLDVDITNIDEDNEFEYDEEMTVKFDPGKIDDDWKIVRVELLVKKDGESSFTSVKSRVDNTNGVSPEDSIDWTPDSSYEGEIDIKVELEDEHSYMGSDKVEPIKIVGPGGS